MPRLRKRGRSYYLCWFEQGKEYRRSLGEISADRARRYLRIKIEDLQRAKLSGVVTLPTISHVGTLADFAQEYLDWHAAEFPASHDRIESAFRVNILPALGHRPLDGLTKREAERFKANRQAAGAKAETVAKEMRALHALLNRAVFLEIIQRNPIKGVRGPASVDSKPPRFYTAAELAMLYRHSKPLPGDEQAKGRPVNSMIEDYAPVWQLMANTGLRRGEAQQLKWEHVSRTHVRVLSESGARTKSGKWRQIPLSKGAQGALRRLRAMTGRDPYVIPRVHRFTLTRAFGKAVQRAGLSGSLHCLRHTFCAHLVMRGVPLRTVQVLAGHASFATTERYAHLSPGHLADSVAGLKL